MNYIDKLPNYFKKIYKNNEKSRQFFIKTQIIN